MAERLVISVDAPASHPDILRVQDVFAHVFEMFQLAAQSEADPEHLVEWKLVSATMNSPFTIVAEAVPIRPGIVDFDRLSDANLGEFTKNLNDLGVGMVPRIWDSGPTKKGARSVMARNRDGIGRTKVSALRVVRAATAKAPAEVAEQVVEFTPEMAAVAFNALGDAANDADHSVKDQIGSIEGYLVQVGTHYNKPAVLLRDRKSDVEVWCIVPDEYRSQVATEANFNDVWAGKRAVVSGRISYFRDGTIARVNANHIRPIESRDVPVQQIQDKTFTGGLSVAEYLEALREGSLG